MTKARYLSLIDKGLAHTRIEWPKEKAKFDETFDFSKTCSVYTGSGTCHYLALLEHNAFERTGDMQRAKAVRDLVMGALEYVNLSGDAEKRFHPMNELIFGENYLLTAYALSKDSGAYSQADHQALRSLVRAALDATFDFVEWGAHNRAMLRAWVMAAGIRCLGEEAEARDHQLLSLLTSETMGHWSIEDSQLYVGIWLYASLMTVDLGGMDKKAYASLPQTKLYFELLMGIMAPNGRLADFGDAYANGMWYFTVAILEWGAATYQDGRMKWAARQILDHAEQKGLILDERLTFFSSVFLMASKWCDDSVEETPLTGGTHLVPEDLIGKKIAFRAGWNKGDTFLLHNFRDEGPDSRMQRLNLRRTLPVLAEKMHHGHSDEGSLVMLMKGESVLLHDGGYRANLPNGRYRDDIYHTRLCFRKGLYQSGSMYDFLHDDGHYKVARTDLRQFQCFDELDYSRVRVCDEDTGAQWDRIIVYVKDPECFVVVDWVEAKADGAMTCANLVHSQTILASGKDWADTAVDTIVRGDGIDVPYENDREYSLVVERLINAPSGHETIPRHWGEGTMLYTHCARNWKVGERHTQVTVLTPKRREDAPKPGAVELVYQKDDTAIALLIKGEKPLTLSFKLDLEYGTHAGCPGYTEAESRIDYGNLQTDAAFAYVREAGGVLSYGFVDGCAISAQGVTLHKTKSNSRMDPDSKQFIPTDHRMRMWTGIARKDR